MSVKERKITVNEMKELETLVGTFVMFMAQNTQRHSEQQLSGLTIKYTQLENRCINFERKHKNISPPVGSIGLNGTFLRFSKR